MLTPNQARAIRAGERSQDRLAWKVASVRHARGDQYEVASWSRPGSFHQVNAATGECACPGYSVAKKHGHECIDVRAVYLSIARELLVIEGSPDADGYETALRYFRSGLLRERYILPSNQAWRYHFATSAPWTIGLSEPARRRELSRVERASVTWSLEAMMAEASQEQAQAA